MTTVQCEACIHFRPDEINPVAGLGWCELRKIARYPAAPHYCRQYEAADGDGNGEGEA